MKYTEPKMEILILDDIDTLESSKPDGELTPNPTKGVIVDNPTIDE